MKKLVCIFTLVILAIILLSNNIYGQIDSLNISQTSSKEFKPGIILDGHTLSNLEVTKEFTLNELSYYYALPGTLLVVAIFEGDIRWKSIVLTDEEGKSLMANINIGMKIKDLRNNSFTAYEQNSPASSLLKHFGPGETTTRNVQTLIIASIVQHRGQTRLHFNESNETVYIVSEQYK